MLKPEMRMAPAGNQGHSEQASNHHVAASPADSSLPEIDPAGLVDGVHVVILHARTSAGGHRWTRRPYFNLPAAQKAVDRATMRGDRAYLVLCQLRAVETRMGGAL